MVVNISATQLSNTNQSVVSLHHQSAHLAQALNRVKKLRVCRYYSIKTKVYISFTHPAQPSQAFIDIVVNIVIIHILTALQIMYANLSKKVVKAVQTTVYAGLRVCRRHEQGCAGCADITSSIPS